VTLSVADLFCGAGGTSCGAELTGAAKVRFAVKTLARIEAGLRRFVGPLVVQWDQQSGAMPGRPVTSPIGTLVTKANQGLAVPYMVQFQPAESIEPRSAGERLLIATMRELGVADIGFRMLSNPELSAAQSFPDSYIFAGNKADVTKQIGNAVCPVVAQAITTAILGA